MHRFSMDLREYLKTVTRHFFRQSEVNKPCFKFTIQMWHSGSLTENTKLYILHIWRWNIIEHKFGNLNGNQLCERCQKTQPPYYDSFLHRRMSLPGNNNYGTVVIYCLTCNFEGKCISYIEHHTHNLCVGYSQEYV